jgi:hypothetical protein
MKAAVTGQVTIAVIPDEPSGNIHAPFHSLHSTCLILFPGIRWNCFRTKDAVDYNQIL